MTLIPLWDVRSASTTYPLCNDVSIMTAMTSQKLKACDNYTCNGTLFFIGKSCRVLIGVERIHDIIEKLQS